MDEVKLLPCEDTVQSLLAVLTNFPSDGKLRNISQDTIFDLLLAGFIERVEVKKPCKNCGTPLLDYDYFRITGGGKLFMAAWSTRPTLVTGQPDHDRT